MKNQSMIQSVIVGKQVEQKKKEEIRVVRY